MVKFYLGTRCLHHTITMSLYVDAAYGHVRVKWIEKLPQMFGNPCRYENYVKHISMSHASFPSDERYSAKNKKMCRRSMDVW